MRRSQSDKYRSCTAVEDCRVHMPGLPMPGCAVPALHTNRQREAAARAMESTSLVCTHVGATDPAVFAESGPAWQEHTAQADADLTSLPRDVRSWLSIVSS
jgi:hypothetical protein